MNRLLKNYHPYPTLGRTLRSRMSHLEFPEDSDNLELLNPYRICKSKSEILGRDSYVGLPPKDLLFNEDLRRLREAKRILSSGHHQVPRCDLKKLCRTLDYKNIQPDSYGSALGFRRTQILIFGEMHRLYRLARSLGLDVYTFTILSERWETDPSDLTSDRIRRVIKSFSNSLRRADSKNVKGFSIAKIDGEFDLYREKFMLHFHGMCVGDMGDYIRGTLRGKHLYRPTKFILRPIYIRRIMNPVNQLNYINKGHWVKGFNNGLKLDARERWSRGRIPEPYSTLYLSQLNSMEIDEQYVLVNIRNEGGFLKDQLRMNSRRAS